MIIALWIAIVVLAVVVAAGAWLYRCALSTLVSHINLHSQRLNEYADCLTDLDDRTKKIAYHHNALAEVVLRIPGVSTFLSKDGSPPLTH